MFSFPSPKVPQINLFVQLISESVTIAVLTFCLQISFCKVFAKKYKYTISPNQEFFAYGISNVVNSFFSGYPGVMEVSRTFLSDGIGIRTQLVALINAIIILAVILGVGPFLASLPTVIFRSLL